MSKIKYTALNSANVRVNNSGDAEKTYDIEANVNVTQNSVVNNIDSGRVTLGGVDKATFNSWGEGMLNISYSNVETEEQCAIINAVNAFIADVKSHVADNKLTAFE
ncbi:MAG: hypothetical protein ACI4C3_02930 [Bacteroides sp.]